MAEQKPNFKSVIRNYILTIGGVLKEEINDLKLEYGFQFIYPNKIGNPMTMVQLKKRKKKKF